MLFAAVYVRSPLYTRVRRGAAGPVAASWRFAREMCFRKDDDGKIRELYYARVGRRDKGAKGKGVKDVWEVGEEVYNVHAYNIRSRDETVRERRKIATFISRRTLTHTRARRYTSRTYTRRWCAYIFHPLGSAGHRGGDGCSSIYIFPRFEIWAARENRAFIPSAADQLSVPTRASVRAGLQDTFHGSRGPVLRRLVRDHRPPPRLRGDGVLTRVPAFLENRCSSAGDFRFSFLILSARFPP